MYYEIILPFDTDDTSFARGFEAGYIWTLMEQNPARLPGMMFHAVNAEMVIRMIEKKGLKLKAKFTDDENWMVFDAC